jgi:hypothetical protein
VPEFCIVLATLEIKGGRREGRVQAAPMARQHLKELMAVITRFGLTTGLPCAMVWPLIPALAGDRIWRPGFLAPVIRNVRHACELSLSVGRPGPHHVAIRVEIVGPGAKRALRSNTSIASRLTFRDDSAYANCPGGTGASCF